MKHSLMNIAAGAFCGLAMLASPAPASAQTQTAQSAMVNLTPDSSAYEIVGTITWTFNRGNHNDVDLTGTAMSYYSNAWDGNAPVRTCTGGGSNCVTPPPTPSAPPPVALKVQQQAQSDRCTFFSGGMLGGDSYTQTVDLSISSGVNKGNWKYVFTYLVTPTQAVDAETAWLSEETGGTVALGFTGFVASESYQRQSSRHKYSFTMTDGGVTRARSVGATLMSGTTAIGSLNLNDLDLDNDSTNDALTVIGAPADFSYFANGGIFGNSTVFGALHAAGRKAVNTVVNILNGVADGSSADNFAGNNNDLAAGNVHVGPFGGSFDGLTEPGDYTVVLAGTLKGNSSAADFGFAVSSNLIQIGGCTTP